jgi:hypothetical protein
MISYVSRGVIMGLPTMYEASQGSPIGADRNNHGKFIFLAAAFVEFPRSLQSG